MGGVGRWIKKHPLETVGLVAGGAVGLPALSGLLSGATVAGVGGANVGAASLLPGALDASVGAGGGLLATLDKVAPYAKFAGQAQELLTPDQPQMPVAPPQGYRGPGPQIPTQGIYDDPELKKRMAMMQQSGRFYG